MMTRLIDDKMLWIQYIDAVILKVLQKGTRAQTFTAIKLLPALLGSMLAGETLTCTRHRECMCLL